ncbi:MAG: TRAP transporter small permease subunit [Sphingomonadaceae bacterium]|nr:TRAP transporter small permease subunit [Sphingomonadaceae bacterium]
MTSRLYRASIWLGGTALLAAASIDAASVLARNLATSVHGSIELIQVAVLIAGSLGLVVALVNNTYARVHLLTDRVPASARRLMERMAAAATGVFFILLLAGSVWIAIDLWQGQELSEVVGVPWRWLRLFANMCFAAAILVLLRHCWRPKA